MKNSNDVSDDFNNVHKLNLGSIYMTFTPLGLPEAQTIAYIQNCSKCEPCGVMIRTSD